MDETKFSPEAPDAPPWGWLGRTAALVVVSGGSKLVLGLLNSAHVVNLRTFTQAVLHREPGRGLITVSNHTSTLDDPGLLSAMLPWGYFWREGSHRGVRWSLCARDICFRSELLRQFFLSGKTLPIDRGGGLGQPAMLTAAALVARGDWLHVFPEGRVSFSGRLGPCKWGIGKLICDCVTAPAAGGGEAPPAPLILPFYHSGMGRVLPRRGRVPRWGHSVTVRVGDFVDVSDLTPRCSCAEEAPQVWRDITRRVCEALQRLEAQSEPNWDQTTAATAEGAGPGVKEKKAGQDPVLPGSSPEVEGPAAGGRVEAAPVGGGEGLTGAELRGSGRALASSQSKAEQAERDLS